MVKGSGKVEKVMHEWGQGKLHSGSKTGPVVTSQKQAVAIALGEARKAGQKVPPAPKSVVPARRGGMDSLRPGDYRRR